MAEANWMSDADVAICNDLANNHPLTDGRDIQVMARRFMMSKNPDIFKVDDSILRDRRTVLGFKGASRDQSIMALTPYERAPGMPFPGICSADPRYDGFLNECAVEFSKMWKPNIDENGFADESAIVSDFSAALTATGVKMSRANAPMIDRSLMLAELGYASGFVNRRHERIARALHECMFGRRSDDTNFNFAVRSNTTMPSFFGGPGSQVQKQDMARTNLAQADRILDAVWNDDLEWLYVNAGFYFAAKTVERAQADSVSGLLEKVRVPKERKVSTPEYALSGGKRGSRVVADKLNVTRDIFNLKNLVGARIRTAYAVCGQISYFMTPFFVGNRANYFEEFGYTWHHTTAEQIYDGIKDFENVIGLDVTLMDQNMPAFLLEKHAEWLKDYFDPRFAKLISWVNGIPYFAPQLSVGEQPYWAGDPMDHTTFNIDVGLSSGRSDNPDLGKWYMTFVYFALMDDYLKDLLEQGKNDVESIASVLKGEHRVFGLKDMGDDAILGLRPGYATLAQRILKDLQQAGKTKRAGLSPYAILDLENGVAFLGNVVLKSVTGKLLVPRPNPVTYFKNRYCPERSINGQYTRYWAHGFVAAQEHYSRAGSIISDIDRFSEEIWRKWFPGVMTPYQMAVKARKLLPLPDGDIRSEMDLKVMLDPDKLNYLTKEGDVSDHIVKLYRSTIEAEFINRTIGHLYR